MVLIQASIETLEKFSRVVNAGFIVDYEHKESIKHHLLANKSVPSDFWSNVEPLSGFKSSSILADENFRRELGSMVGELVTGGQRRPNLEGSAVCFLPVVGTDSLGKENQPQGQEESRESDRSREHQRGEHHQLLDPGNEKNGERRQSTSRHLTTVGRTEFAWDMNLILRTRQTPLLWSGWY